jgi:hypothetical protein
VWIRVLGVLVVGEIGYALDAAARSEDLYGSLIHRVYTERFVEPNTKRRHRACWIVRSKYPGEASGWL